MTTLAERLEEASQIEDRVKQEALLNQTFTIHSARMITFKEKDTEREKDAMVAMISFEGQEEQVEAWMDGVRLRPQIVLLQEENALPVIVKLVKENKAYLVKFVSEAAANTVVKEPAVTQGRKTVQAIALEMFDAARTAKSDDDLANILADCGISVRFNNTNKITLHVNDLTTQMALALKKALA